MPANKNAMTRYMILDELLSNRYHNYSLDDLTNEVNLRLGELYPNTNGVVRRTIEKDIYYLEYEGPFMVDIERYIAVGYNKDKQETFNKQCLRYSNPAFSIFKKDLSDDEKYLLCETLSILGQFEGLPNLDGIKNLQSDFGVKHNGRKIVSFTKNPIENSNIFGELFTAISQRQVIDLQYHKFTKPQTERSVYVHPYLLKEYNRRWFLFAAAESDGKFLCFALDRIDKVIPLPSHKYIDYEGDINEKFEDIIGVTITDGPVLSIYFWVSNVSKDYVSTKPIHESQRNVTGSREKELRDKYNFLIGGSFFRIDCKDNYELIRELTSFGQELIVLEPVPLQKSISKRVSEMNNLYKKFIPRT